MAERLPRIGQPLPLIAVPPGRHIVRQGDPHPLGCVVVSGALLVYAVDAEGRVAGFDVVGPGDAVAHPRSGAYVSVRALTSSSLRPAGDAEVAGSAIGHLARLAALATDLAWSDVPTRMQRRLDDLAERFGRPVAGGVRIGLDLTQDDLAALAGTSRETANRVLQRAIRTGRLRRVGPRRYEVRTRLQVLAAAGR
jgi:CRP/FNR family transcriptional regulator, cyclic AMP receptor protein